MQIARIVIRNNLSQPIETLGSWKARLSNNNLTLSQENILDEYRAGEIYRIVTVLVNKFSHKYCKRDWG